MVTLPSTLRPIRQAMLYAKVAGYLKTIRVDRGDKVRAGQPLAEIEVPELLADLDKQKAEAQVAQIASKRLGDALAKSPNLVMPQTVDDAKGRHEIAQATLKRTETLLAYARISAPFAGVVTKRWVDPGAFVQAGNGGSPLLTIVDLSTVRVEVPIPEREVPFVKAGLTARVMIEELPGKRFDGTITRFAHALDEATRTMAAEVEIKNPAEELRPGMYAMVQIILQEKADALTIPIEALVMEKGKGFAFTVDGGKAKRLPIKLGFKDDKSVEVTDGLKADQPVLMAAGYSLTDGQAVTPVEPK